MQKLDPHTLFSIFEKGDEEVYKEHGMEDQLKNPFVLMGMVLKGLENYKLMDIMYKNNFPQEYKRNQDFIRAKYYNTLYKYLDRIDSYEFDSLYSIGESFETAKVKMALEHLLHYFEYKEEYEKCATIKRFIDHLRFTKEIRMKLDIWDIFLIL